MNKDMRIFIAGHGGMVGSAIQRCLQKEGFDAHSHLPACRPGSDRPACGQDVFYETPWITLCLAAARVGGIHANNAFPADFIYQNLMIQTNVIHAAYEAGVNHLLFLGSSCIYPKNAPQPMREEALLGGCAGTHQRALCHRQNCRYQAVRILQSPVRDHFRSVMPTNLYGPNDNYDLETSHVLPALIRKFHLAKLAERRAWEAIEQDERRCGQIPVYLREALGVPPAGTGNNVAGTHAPTAGVVGIRKALPGISACGRSGGRLPFYHGAAGRRSGRSLPDLFIA